MNGDTEHSRTIRLLRAWRDLEPGEDEKARVSRRLVHSLSHPAWQGIRQDPPFTRGSPVSAQALLFGFASASVAAFLLVLTGVVRPPAEVSAALRVSSGPGVLTLTGFAPMALAAPLILAILPSRSR
ncbi:MAG: hypothetical protein ACM3X4_03120 [Ignavibacteriales bacterium]